jgi:predicted nucleic acid-binding protein
VAIAALDSNILIYIVNANSDWSDKATVLLDKLTNQGQVVCSELVRTEVLMQPAKIAKELFNDVAEYLSSIENLSYFAVNQQVSEMAALLGGQHSLKLADAVHIASAVIAGATAFYTNDKQLLKVVIKGLKISSL